MVLKTPPVIINEVSTSPCKLFKLYRVHTKLGGAGKIEHGTEGSVPLLTISCWYPCNKMSEVCEHRSRIIKTNLLQEDPGNDSLEVPISVELGL